MQVSTFVYIYVAGGLTFIPLVLLCALTFAYFVFTSPAPPEKASSGPQDSEEPVQTLDDETVSDKSKVSVNDPEVTAAYFAVCREYVPGGINGKPPERSTPAGEVLIAESPSVYQSMYRSIFERGKTQIPTIEADKKDGKAVKKARNVLFVVMRHGHLMLYDDSEQLEVRHVISLAHHELDLHGGGEPLTEGDLWIKRNCIRLTRRPSASKATPLSKPFYLFSDNCSEKEDFYHAMLQYQANADIPAAPPKPKNFDTQDMLKLIQQLHDRDADANTRWLNAMIGRIFLAMYKTDDIENFIRAKINRKISRVPKPNFITSIQIQDIDMGDSGPIISNPRLKEMNINGDTIIEFDIKYNGSFKLQMGAVARIDLGSRLKAREVTLVMAGTLRRLSGHMLVRIKPPPSNRMWMTFETMPQLDLSIEPIVSSRQITYGVILRAIESRIREVMGETIVFPNWDDSPFLDTSRKEHRGGVYETNPIIDDGPSPLKSTQSQDHAFETAVHELAKADDAEAEDPGLSSLKAKGQKTLSMPTLFDPVQQKLSQRKGPNKSVVSLAGDVASTTGASTSLAPTTSAPPATSPPLLPARKPKTMRSSSFAAVATPLVSTEGHDIEAMKPEKSKRNSEGAVDLIKEVNTRSRSQVPSPDAFEAESGPEDIPPLDVDRDVLVETPDEDEQLSNALAESNHHISEALRRLSEPSTPGKEVEDPMTSPPRSPSVSSIPISVSKAPSVSSSSDKSIIGHPRSPSNLSSAATAAKKWGLDVLNRRSTPSSTSLAESFNSFRSGKSSFPAPASTSLPTTAPNPDALRAAMAAERAPMGRGQPLPPPGTPLPGPNRSLWSTSSLSLGMGNIKRKPISGPAPPPRKEGAQSKKVPPPLPARRRSSANELQEKNREGQAEPSRPDSILVVDVPDEDDDSLPTSPIDPPPTDVGNAQHDGGGLDMAARTSIDNNLTLTTSNQSGQSTGHKDLPETLEASEDKMTSVETLKKKKSDAVLGGHGTHDQHTTIPYTEHMDYSSESHWSEEHGMP